MPSTRLRLVVDENVPFARDAFHRLGDVRLLPGAAITREAVQQADALVVRSVTRVGRALLRGTPVQFVGTATAGTDHVDQPALTGLGIAFASAPGSNAQSVVEYVLAALLALSIDETDHRLADGLRGTTVAVVGCGQVGGRLLTRLRALGMRTLAVDPPLARAGTSDELFVSLDEAVGQADVVTLHIPLTHDGPDATRRLLDAGRIARMRPGAVLVNAARGCIVDGRAVREALQAGGMGAAVLDVWPEEPSPDPFLIRSAAIGTPHIAGYSFDGKVDGTAQVARALAEWAGRPGDAWDPETVLGGALTPLDAPDASLPENVYLDRLARQCYAIREDAERFRRLAVMAPAPRVDAFRRLRKTYTKRRAWERFTLAESAVPEPFREAVLVGLGVNSG